MLLPSFSSVVAGALAATPAVYALPQSSGSGSGSGSGSSSSRACNNSPDLCSRNYNNVTHMGAHGSSFLRDSDTSTFGAAGNQNYNATDALAAGLRLLQAQVHKENNALHLCHTSCEILDAGLLRDWLSRVNDWVVANPDEVVTLLLVNYDKVSASEIGKAFNDSGIADLAYRPPGEGPSGDWPTLGDMIGDKKRVVSFATNIDPSTDYPFLMPEFDYVFETAFEVQNLGDFNCTLDRPSRLDSAAAALSSSYLSLVNHFKYQSLSEGGSLFVPDVSNIEIVNSDGTSQDGNLGKHLQECRREWSAAPNFVLVDFFDEGQVLAATDRMNGISGATGREAVEDSSDESKGNGPDRRLGMGALTAFIAAAVLLV